MMSMRMGRVMPVARLVRRAARASLVRLRVLFRISRKFRFAVRATEQHLLALERQAVRRVGTDGHATHRISKRLAGGAGVMCMVFLHGFALRV